MFSTIVVGATGSESAPRAVEAAAGLAERFDAQLHLVSVVKTPALVAAASDGGAITAAAEWEAEARTHEEQGLRTVIEQLERRGLHVRAHVAGGDPSAVLCEVAQREGADLIVVGNRGMKGARRVLGSVPNSVSHHACCSVLIVNTA
jgi:nucleotide-binding universal stress UspA family protein